MEIDFGTTDFSTVYVIDFKITASNADTTGSPLLTWDGPLYLLDELGDAPVATSPSGPYFPIF